MIEQELAKNILNNLLDIQTEGGTSGFSGNEQDKELALSNDFVNNVSTRAERAKRFVNMIINNEKTQLTHTHMDGYAPEFDADENKYIHNLGNFGSKTAAENMVYQTFKEEFKESKLVCYSTVEKPEAAVYCYLPIKEVTPNYGKNEEPAIFPVGFHPTEIENFFAPINDGNFIAVDDTGTYKNQGLLGKEGLDTVQDFITQLAQYYAKVVLSSISSYSRSAVSYFKNYYTNMGVENSEPVTQKITIKYKIYKQKPYEYTIGAKYYDSSKKTYVWCLQTKTYHDWILEEEEKDITVSGWYYSQTYSNDKFYPKRAYLGLFTKMPEPDGTNFIEPPKKDGLNNTYQRMSLHQGLFSGDYVFNDIIQVSKDEKEFPGYALINNREIIMFPEILAEEGWGNILGFGVFENSEPMDGEKPYFWGYVKGAPDTPVSTSKDHVPLFRPNQFEVFLS